jgi:hypothetical protein
MGTSVSPCQERQRLLAAVGQQFRVELGVADDQGLTLVHFSPQLEPCLTQENTLHTLNIPLQPLNTGYTTPYVHPLSHTKRSS